MPIDSVFALDVSGKILIEKHYRGKRPRAASELFMAHVTAAKRISDVPPVIKEAGPLYLFHVQHADVFWLATARSETPPLLVISFLNEVVANLAQYFSSLAAAVVAENFSTIYQLLDEMCDNGVPFRTESNHLQGLIAPPNAARKVMGSLLGKSGVASELSGTALRWRRQVAYPGRNEIKFDLVEEIDCIVGVGGRMVRGEVHGVIDTQCQLSGMPDLDLVLENPSMLEDVALHACVRYKMWESAKKVSFIPPDGYFRLMAFRVKGTVSLPMYVNPTITWNEKAGNGSVSIMMGTKHTGDASHIDNVVVRIPFPSCVASSTLSADVGGVVFDASTKTCTWTVSRLDKNKSPVLSGLVNLATGAKAPTQNPVMSLAFTVEGFSASGVKVTRVGVTGMASTPFKGVRSITKGGRVFIRS